MVTRVLLVGLGTIARTHLEALGRRDDVTVVGGVDPAGGAHPFPVHLDLAPALDRLEPDLVVVATPTDTHVDLVRTVLDGTDAHVLSEKPLARTLAGTRRLAEVPGVGERLSVAHHFAFSPEVEWALDQVQRHPAWGRPSRVLSVFHDPYAGLPPDRLASYVSTWIDSGPNQLSLLAPFTGPSGVVAHGDRGDRSVTVLEHDGGRTTLVSSWVSADTSKQTTLEFGDGAVQLRLDHTSMTGLVLQEGEVVDHVGYAGTLTRKQAHYAGLYRTVLDGTPDVRTGLGLAVSIAELLEAATAPGMPQPGTAWSSIS